MTRACFVVSTLLEDGPTPTKYGRLVRVRTPQGVVTADWNGYYAPNAHSIGYLNPEGHWSHGMLHQGDELLDPVPSYEEWQTEKEQRDREHQEKLARMRREVGQ